MYRTVSPPGQEPARLIRLGWEWIPIRNELEDEVVEKVKVLKLLKVSFPVWLPGKRSFTAQQKGLGINCI